MLPAAVAAFTIKPPSILNRFRKLHIHGKTTFSMSPFRTLKESAIVYPKSLRLKNVKVAGSIETGILGGGGGGERISPSISAFEQEALIDNGSGSFHQTPGGLHTLLNRLSKWVVAALFGGFILLRHDALALWVAMGSIINVILSITLKQILKQERPVPGISSGHGMPSSHAQSIFFTTVILTLSEIQWQGLNGVTGVFSLLVVALGSYFSWLRILLRYHTTSQVVVGAIVGSIFSVLWFWAWKATVFEAYNSNLWVRILVIVGTVCFWVGFILDVLRNWTKDEQ